MLMDLATDPYVPNIGTLAAHASRSQAIEWIERQAFALRAGTSYSFCAADSATDDALGTAGLNLTNLDDGRASAGYSVAPRSRGRRVAEHALIALTTFAWSLPDLYRVELYIEPWNIPSVRTAERAGYQREGLLREFQEIAGSRVDLLLFSVLRSSG